jgi:hypothetical protein
VLIRDDNKSKKKKTEFERFVESRKTDEFERFKASRYEEPKKMTVDSIAPKIESPFHSQRQGFVIAPRITPVTIQNRLRKEQEEQNKRLREIEAQQRTMTSLNPMAYKAIAEQKQALLRQTPTVENVKKKLVTEQARTSIAANPQDEYAWLTLAANTLDSQSLKQYQLDSAFKKATQDALYGEIQHEQAVSKAKAEIDARFPNDGKLKVIAQSLSDWWLGTKAASNTLQGLGGGNTYNMRKIESGRVVSQEELLAGEQKAKGQLRRGAEQYQQMGINREATVGDDAIKGFLYDFTSFVPDMLTTIVLALATSGTGNVAQMGAKEIGKKLLSKETRKVAMVELAKRAVISPETLPLGAKIFSQSYQRNLVEGMDDGKAFFTAFINAYGQSVLEGGGVNKAFKEGGMEKAVDFLKSSLGEGFEEVKQNWWEGSVDRIVAGKDIPIYSDDPNAESIINPQRDLYSAALGTTGGFAGGAMATPGTAINYIKEKTTPQISYDLEGYTKQMTEYEKRKGVPEESQKGKNTKYRGETYAQTELIDAADQIMDKMINYQKEILKSESNDVESMQEWEAFQDEIENTTPESIRESLLRGYASLDILDMAKEQAYKNRTPGLQELTKAETAEPKIPEFTPVVDTSKMNKTVLKNMEADLALAVEDGIDQRIADMAMEGTARKTIAKELGVEPRMVRSIMALKGIPDTNNAAFQKWKTLKTFSEVRAFEGAKTAIEAPVRLIDDAEATNRITNVKALTGATAVRAADLEIGHLEAQKLGRRLGVDVVFYESGRANTRGMFSSREANTIFINRAEATEGKVVMDVFGHEFLHHVNTKHGDLYKKLREVVGNSLTTEKINQQLSKYAMDKEYQQRLSGDRELLIEEMLAEEAGSLFTDRQFWQNLYERDVTTAQKLARVIRSFINRILTDDKKESGNLGVMTETQIKDFQKKFEEVVAEVMGRDVGKIQTSEVVVEAASAAPLYSVRTWTGEEKSAAIKDLIEKLGLPKNKVSNWLKSLDNAMAIILNDPIRLDYEASDLYTALKDNSDPHYDKSLDFSTLCKKRLVMQGTIEEIQTAIGRGLSPAEFLKVRKTLLDKGVVVSCGICYVDSRRIELGKVANKFIEENPDLDPDLFLTQEGYDRLKVEQPKIYSKFNSSTGVRGIKTQESRTEYRGEILKHFSRNKNKVKAYNERSGLRWQSWSDFEIPHLLDAMQAIVDMSRVGLTGHAYTKVPEFVELLGDTGLMINLSLIPKGESGMKNGKLVFDSIEGMDFETALNFRNRFDKTAGTIAIGINDDQILALLRSPDIDYVIPYHISGLSAENRALSGQGIEKWTNYESTQREVVFDWDINEAYGGKNHEKARQRKVRVPEMFEWWDNKKTPQENQQKYLELCEQFGVKPKFEQFSHEENYWKLLIDRRMVDGSGNNIKMAPPKPIFKDVAISKLLSDYVEEHRSLPSDKSVAKALIEEFSAETVEKSIILMQNLKVSEQEAVLGAQALEALEEKFSVQTPTGREVDGSRRAKTIARDYTKKFLSKGKVEFIGQKIKDTHELAVIAQVLRDPRFETFRMFFLNDDGQIVHHTGVSSRMPGSSAIFVGKDGAEKEQWINTEINFAKSMDATSFYLMHNHPSGQPMPSGQDFDMTGRFAGMFSGIVEFKGHIVINSGQYGLISPDNFKEASIHDLNLGSDKLLMPDKPHALLGRKIGSAEDVVEMAKELKGNEGYSTIFYMSPGLKVRGIQEIPSEVAFDQKKLKSHLKKNALDFGGHRPFLVAENMLVFEEARKLIDDAYLFEVINATTGDGARGALNDSRPGVWQGREEGVGESAWEGREKYSVKQSPRWILNNADKIGRKNLIRVLQQNDSNGIYSDEDAIDEGYDPLTFEVALELLENVFSELNLKDMNEKAFYVSENPAQEDFDDYQHVKEVDDAEEVFEDDDEAAPRLVDIKALQKKYEDLSNEIYSYKDGLNEAPEILIKEYHKAQNAWLKALPADKFSVPTIDIKMDEKKVPRDLKGDLANLYRRIVDKNHPLNKVSDTVKMKAANTALVSGSVERILTHALVDTKGRDVGTSWKTVTEPFATNKDFWQYMAQRHNIDRSREGKPVDPGMTPDDSIVFAANAERLYPEYRAWGDSVTAWIDQFMKTWAVNTGIIDAETYDEWREMYPSYFPTYREFSDLEDVGHGGPGKRFVDLPNPVKKATGSDRDLTNPVGNVMQMVNKVVRTARYNEVGLSLLEEVRNNPQEMQKFVEEIPANIGMFRSKKLDNVIAIWEGGSPQYLQINDKMLLEALQGLPKIINNAQVMRKVTGVFKGLITQYNPLFALRNIFRDIPTAYVYGSQDNPLFFLMNLAKAGYEIATDTGGAEIFKNIGGAGSGQFAASEAAQYAKLLQPSAASKLKVPLKMIEWLNNLTEQAPRISEFNYVLEKTGDVEKALYAAQNVTVNFARGGDITKQVEPFVPYLNASVQGLDRFFQAFNFKKDPSGALKRMAKAGIAVTAPQIVSYLVSMADDEEKYKMLDQRTKDAYYVFPKGDGTYWKIPKSRELGVLWGSLFERALAGSYKGFAGTVATNFTPVDPFTSNIFAPIIWNLPVNKDFAGRTIVPQSLQKYSGKNQYDDNTSEIAKAIGRLTNISPKQMDYIIRSYTGVVGQILLPATTERAGIGNAIERATVGAFTVDPAFNSQAMTDFYDKLDEAERVKNDKNIEQSIKSSVVTPEERHYNAMNKISSKLSKTTKYINANLKADDPKIQKIRLAMNNHLKRAVKATTLADLVKIQAEMSAELYKLGVR